MYGPGTTYNGIPFKVWSGPAGLGCTAPGIALNGMPVRVWSGLADLGCTAPGIAYSEPRLTRFGIGGPLPDPPTPNLRRRVRGIRGTPPRKALVQNLFWTSFDFTSTLAPGRISKYTFHFGGVVE